jgi:hypothetical protein
MVICLIPRITNMSGFTMWSRFFQAQQSREARRARRRQTYTMIIK